LRIIDFLSQELQIAVDSLKSSYPNNKKGLEVVQKYLDKLNTGYEEYLEPAPDYPTKSNIIWVQKSTVVPWLKSFKDDKVYKEYVCAVDNQASDTISRLVQLTNEYWKKPDLKTSNKADTFKNVIFTSFLLQNNPDKPLNDDGKPVDNSKFSSRGRSCAYPYQFGFKKTLFNFN